MSLLFYGLSFLALRNVLATAVSARMVQAVDNPFDVDAASKPHLFRVFAALELVYRCYVIWAERKSIIVIPCISVLATTGVAYFSTRKFSLSGVTSVLDPRIPYILGILTNIILVVLTVEFGGYGAKPVLSAQAYSTVATELLLRFCLSQSGTPRIVPDIDPRLETGGIYCLCGILLAAFATPDASFVANILPTLIIVRVGLGHNMHDTVQDIAAAPTTRKSQKTAIRPRRSTSEVLDIKWEDATIV
ncbi:hypothetical protein B0H17DRAFT_1155237 [Mycena rosella]|uniref:Uncharacterized protein n=1 Tax=Mycena rosella TaxID=1033263 RepID=A0AAD7AWX7_MYCRO|nr:hypothetical protein B0H17DRAFT_1155237 [Mycena rosella]